MAGLTDFCSKITTGYDPCGKTPSAPGIEAGLYMFNLGDFTPTYDPTNPLICTGFTRKDNDTVMFMLKGFGDTFNAVSKVQKKDTGPRFMETISAYISDNSSASKQLILNGSIGRVCFIVVNNDNSTDGAFELYGAVSGLQFSDNTQRDAADENFQGSWKVEAANPPKLLEPYPPRAISIPAGEGPATYASTLAALQLFLAPAA